MNEQLQKMIDDNNAEIAEAEAILKRSSGTLASHSYILRLEGVHLDIKVDENNTVIGHSFDRPWNCARLEWNDADLTAKNMVNDNGNHPEVISWEHATREWILKMQKHNEELANWDNQ